MMDRIEEYLSGLEFKHKIMLYASVFILGGIIYFYFNYTYLNEKYSKLMAQKREWLKTTSTGLQKLKISVNVRKKELNILKKKYLEESEDLKYLVASIRASKRLYMNQEKFYNLFNQIINASKEAGLGSSFVVDSKSGELLNQYNIKVFGKIYVYDFDNIINFLYKVKNLPALISVKNVSFLNCYSNTLGCLDVVKKMSVPNDSLKQMQDLIYQMNPKNNNEIFYFIEFSIKGFK